MGKNIVLGITASIAAYKACDIVSSLRKKGFSVHCVMSQDSAHFVTPLTLETLSGNKVTDSMFSVPDNRDPVHISLADKADLVLIAPATSDIIGKISGGICDDILTCTIAATRAPVLIAPAMNDNMYRNPILQDKIMYLKEKGYRFAGPVEGHLACGRTGVGHLAPLEDIVNETEKLLGC